MFKYLCAAPGSDEEEKAEFLGTVEALEEHLRGTPDSARFLCGDRMGLYDILVIPLVQRIFRVVYVFKDVGGHRSNHSASDLVILPGG